MTATSSIIRQIKAIGYRVSTHRVNETVEMHAVLLADPTPENAASWSATYAAVHVARCNDGDGDEETYRCACLLATAVGIDLDDG